MKKRTATVGGGLILVGIALGMLLNLFRGPGGGGEGANVLVQTQGDTTIPIEEASPDEAGDDPAADVPVHSASQAQSVSPQSAGVAPVQVVHVVIDDREYHLRATGADGTEQLTPISLAELVEKVRAATGNEDGIRVRIVRRDSSRAAAEKLLNQSLLDAGVAVSAMQWDD